MDTNTNPDTVYERLNNVDKKILDKHKMDDVDSDKLTVEKIKSFIPKGVSTEVTEALVEKINNTYSDTGLSQDIFNDQVLSYMHLVSGKGRSLEKLVNALKYCNLKMIPGMTNERAWAIVFPDKYNKIVSEKRFVGSHVSMYNSSEMVVEIDKLLMIPVSIQYAPMFHHSVKKLFDLSNGVGANAEDKVSPHVQLMAASELAKLTKMPDVAKVEVDVKVNQGSIIDEYEKAINMMANAKLNQITEGNGQGMFNIVNAPIRAKKAKEEIIDAEVE